MGWRSSQSKSWDDGKEAERKGVVRTPLRTSSGSHHGAGWQRGAREENRWLKKSPE